ncbi:MAG: uncharacterized SAM-binding protein YcdF (DUF218 family) [Myxococcota bacterium]
MIAGGMLYALIRGWRGLFGWQAKLTGTYDLIVVPGAAVRFDGSPSPALARRVKAGAALWKAGHAPILVVSGGVVTHPPAEGMVGTRLAAQLKVPVTALVAETVARTTAENALYSSHLNLGPRVLVVTDDFHVARCDVLFRRHFDEVCVVGCRSPHRFRFGLRETIAVLLLLVY